MANIKEILGIGSDRDDYEDENYAEEATEKPSKRSKSAKAGVKAAPDFILIKPDDRDAMYSAADDVLKGKAVILNLENVQKDIKRITLFLYGVAYALDGNVKKVGDYTYLIVPGGVDITGEIEEAGDISF